VLNYFILACNEFGINVKVVTFDGLEATITMVNILGANIKFPEKRPSNCKSAQKRTPQETETDRMKYAPIKTTLVHSKTEEDIYVMLHTCHMIKLAHNLLARTRKGIPGFSKPAKWSYIKSYLTDIGAIWQQVDQNPCLHWCTQDESSFGCSSFE
jgi:hypothetical protein